jgi:hypothetical protein
MKNEKYKSEFLRLFAGYLRLDKKGIPKWMKNLRSIIKLQR